VSKVNRAAQFLPFDALKGLSEALRKKEEEHNKVDRKELSEDQENDLSRNLCRATEGAHVEITFYSDGHYFSANGIVNEQNCMKNYLKIGDKKIFFEDIYSIEIL